MMQAIHEGVLDAANAGQWNIPDRFKPYCEFKSRIIVCLGRDIKNPSLPCMKKARTDAFYHVLHGNAPLKRNPYLNAYFGDRLCHDCYEHYLFNYANCSPADVLYMTGPWVNDTYALSHLLFNNS